MAQVIDRQGAEILTFIILKCLENKTIRNVRTGSHEVCDAYQSFIIYCFMFFI